MVYHQSWKFEYLGLDVVLVQQRDEPDGSGTTSRHLVILCALAGLVAAVEPPYLIDMQSSVGKEGKEMFLKCKGE